MVDTPRKIFGPYTAVNTQPGAHLLVPPEDIDAIGKLIDDTAKLAVDQDEQIKKLQGSQDTTWKFYEELTVANLAARAMLATAQPHLPLEVQNKMRDAADAVWQKNQQLNKMRKLLLEDLTSITLAAFNHDGDPDDLLSSETRLKIAIAGMIPAAEPSLPISTAPKDGTTIMAWRSGGWWWGRYNDIADRWEVRFGDGWLAAENITDWQPVPTAPKGA
jgi:hypothetical protein